MKTYLTDDKHYSYKNIKPNKVLKFKLKERNSGNYGRNKRGKR